MPPLAPPRRFSYHALAMQQPCDGVTVVDFSQSLAGALTTMFLADTGAEVITVEPPGGDPLRGSSRLPSVAARTEERGARPDVGG